MSQADISVVATIKAKPGKEASLEETLKTVVEATHKEPGCIRYALHRSQSDPRTFIFIEKWASEKDLQGHLGSPHVAAALAKKDELIESLDIVPLVPLKSGDPGKEAL